MIVPRILCLTRAESPLLDPLKDQTIFNTLEQVTPVPFPLFRIVPFIRALDLPPTTQGLAVTSQNSVAILKQSGAPLDWILYCNGEGTAHYAQSIGFSRVCNANGTGKDLAELITRRVSSDRGPVFYGSGPFPRVPLAQLLAAKGLRVIQKKLYDVEFFKDFSSEQINVLQDPHLWGIVFFSPLGAATFNRFLKNKKEIRTALGKKSKMVYFFCLSQAVAAQLDPSQGMIKVSTRPLLRALLEIVDDSNRREFATC